MMRIAIVGNSGSGKSTLAGRLGGVWEAPVLDLDTVAWEPGKIAQPRDPEAAAVDVRGFCAARERWIVEGCYASLIEVALDYGPVLIFLDPGVERCLENCRARPWEPQKYRSRAEQDERLEFLLAWVADYPERDGEMSLVGHEALFHAYEGARQRIRDFGELTPEVTGGGRAWDPGGTPAAG